MTKYLIPAAAIAAVLVSAPAAANDGLMYVGGDIGILLPRDSEIDVTDVATGATFNNAADWQYDTGFDVSGQVGYDFGMFKLEGELGYKHASFTAISPSTDWLNFLHDRLVVVNPLSTAVVASDIDLHGGVDIIDTMVNGLVDIGPDHGFGGYLGGGIGMGWAKAYGESSSSFAWQFIAGVKYPIGDQLDIGLKYKYFDLAGLDFVPGVDVHGTNFDTNLDSRFSTHSIDVNLTYNF